MISRLRDLIEIKTKQVVTNEYGEEEVNYVTFAKVYANVLTISAKEFFNKGEQHEVNYKVIIRHIEGIKPYMIVEWNGKTLEITGILDADVKRKYITLLCKEIAND